MTRFKYPRDLAREARRKLDDLVQQNLGLMPAYQPTMAVLESVIGVVYLASQQQEEGRPIRPRLAFVPRETTGVTEEWTRVPFSRPVALDVRTLVKLTPAVDVSQAALAVDKTWRSPIQVWGIVKLGTDVERLNLGVTSDAVIPTPPLLEIRAFGPGTVEVSVLNVPVAVLRDGDLTDPGLPVLQEHGHVARALARICAGAAISTRPDDYRELVRRIVLAVARQDHGGLVLIDGEIPRGIAGAATWEFALPKPEPLSHLEQTLRQTELQINGANAQVAAASTPAAVSTGLGALARAHAQTRQTRQSITDAVGFLASLAAVDGGLVLDAGLGATSFGVIIDSAMAPGRIRLAQDVSAAGPGRRRPSGRGTRHRAAAAFVRGHEDRLAFAVSQDGEVSAWASSGDEVICWRPVDVEAARLLHVYRSRVRRRPASGRSPRGARPVRRTQAATR